MGKTKTQSKLIYLKLQILSKIFGGGDGFDCGGGGGVWGVGVGLCLLLIVLYYMRNCGSAFYLYFGDLRFDLVWSSYVNVVICPEVTLCGWPDVETHVLQSFAKVYDQTWFSCLFML